MLLVKKTRNYTRKGKWALTRLMMGEQDNERDDERALGSLEECLGSLGLLLECWGRREKMRDRKEERREEKREGSLEMGRGERLRVLVMGFGKNCKWDPKVLGGL